MVATTKIHTHSRTEFIIDSRILLNSTLNNNNNDDNSDTQENNMG